MRKICTAAAVAALSVFASSAAQAEIVYSGVVNLNVPNTFTGLYVNVVNGTTYTGPSTFPPVGGPGFNFDISIYNLSPSWFFFAPGSQGQSSPVPAAQKGYVAATPGGAASALTFGTEIGPSNTFNVEVPSGSLVTTGAPEIFGFRFRNETDGLNTTHFGWARVILTAGQPGTLVDYAFESTPLTPIGAGVIPEPGSVLAVIGAAGLLLRRRRM